MDNVKLGFEEFIVTVDNEAKEFVESLHQELINAGCKIEVKSAKSGYLVSYILNKKTVANYVFRKKGLIARIYANKVNTYMGFLDTLPEVMVNSIREAPDCKRLINPEACNSKCAMGYDFVMNGKRFQKCRSNAFMFLVSDESKPFIKTFLMNEVSTYN